MHQPAWKKLVEELKDSGHQSVYLDRLRERLNVSASQDDLKKEILREMASALGRAEDKVNVALLRLELLEARIEGLRTEERSGPELEAEVDAFNAQRKEALHSLWELTIHREALGFRRNEILKEFYPVPPAKLCRAGDRRTSIVKDGGSRNPRRVL